MLSTVFPFFTQSEKCNFVCVAYHGVRERNDDRRVGHGRATSLVFDDRRRRRCTAVLRNTPAANYLSYENARALYT